MDQQPKPNTAEPIVMEPSKPWDHYRIGPHDPLSEHDGRLLCELSDQEVRRGLKETRRRLDKARNTVIRYEQLETIYKEILKMDEAKAKRITFHEITKHAIDNAIEHPRTLDMNLVHAQQMRRILDRLVGYELSPLLWK